MLTEGFTFKLNDDGVVLNTDSTGLPFVDITDVNGLDSAPFRETMRDHEGTDGGYLDAEYETGREISFEGTVFGEVADLETFLDSLKANYAPRTTPVPLYVMSDASVTERLMFVKPRGVRYQWSATTRKHGEIPVRFGMYAEDPRIYGITEYSIDIGFGAVAYTGIGFPLGFSFGFGGSSLTTDGAYVNNAGNRPTPAVITLVGPVTNPQVINETVSVTMSFNITLSSSDSLAIDLGNRTITLNGTANRRGTLVGTQWFLLEPGDNFLRFRGTSGSAPASMNVTYRDAWR